MKERALRDGPAASDLPVPDRRRFLQMMAAGVAVACAACSANQVGPAEVGDVSAGNVSDLPVGSLRALGSQPVAIGRDSGGVYAMTLTCTHQGCNMATQGSVSSNGIDCNCHGSRFDTNGNATSGPAEGTLTHFEVTADGAGALTVHGKSQVDAGTRLKV